MEDILLKKLALLLMVFATVYVMPVTAQAEENENPVTDSKVTVQEKLIESLVNSNTVKIKYATGEHNIYKNPFQDSEICGKTLINTSFEVIYEDGGWSMITTCNGVSYIETQYLCDEIQSYSEEDLYVMAHLLAGEAQSQPDSEQRYVGSVALNRVAHPEFPNTLKGVVFQSGQYACTKDGNYYREPTERNWANAKWLLENGSVFPDNIIWQSGGRQGKGVYLKTQWHYYCY